MSLDDGGDGAAAGDEDAGGGGVRDGEGVGVGGGGAVGWDVLEGLMLGDRDGCGWSWG